MVIAEASITGVANTRVEILPNLWVGLLQLIDKYLYSAVQKFGICKIIWLKIQKQKQNKKKKQ